MNNSGGVSPSPRDGIRKKPAPRAVRCTGPSKTAGPREPRRGAPYTFVTTDRFLMAFGLETLRDLPDPEQLAEAGLSRA